MAWSAWCRKKSLKPGGRRSGTLYARGRGTEAGIFRIAAGAAVSGRVFEPDRGGAVVARILMREASTLRAGQMDKMETEGAGARSTRHRERRPAMVGLATGATSDFAELFLSLSRRRNVMTTSPDDHMLVEACRAGQTEAFGVLVQRYQERLYQVLLHLCGSPEDARDVLQDTFLAPTRSSINFTAAALFTRGSTGSA